MSDSPQVQSTPPYSPQLETPAAQPKNVLGLISMIVGIAAFVGAFIPVLNYLTGILAIAGIVLGVMALLKVGRPKKAALTGTIISAIALILSIVLAIAYTGAILRAIDEAQSGIRTSDTTVDGGTLPLDDTSETPSDDASDDATDDAAGGSGDEVGTRANPAPLGTIVELSDDSGLQYRIALGASNLSADALVAAENQFNEVAPEGMQFAMVPVTATYMGTETGSPYYDITIEFVSAAGTTHTTFDSFVVEPAPSLSDINELYSDGTGTGNVVVLIPTADAAQGTWAVSSLLALEKFFYAAE